MSKTEMSDIAIYIARGMHVTHEIEKNIVPHHKDWHIIDYSNVCDDDETNELFQKAGVRGFPVIVAGRHVLASGQGIMTSKQVEDIIVEYLDHRKEEKHDLV